MPTFYPGMRVRPGKRLFQLVAVIDSGAQDDLRMNANAPFEQTFEHGNAMRRMLADHLPANIGV